MAFVNEIIPESVKAKFNFPVRTMNDGSKPTLWKWAIDKERDIALVNTDKEGGYYEGTTETRSFMLLFQGLHIAFVGECKYIGKSKTAMEIEWLICSITEAKSGGIDVNEIKKTISDALTAMGWLYSTVNIVKTSVAFKSA